MGATVPLAVGRQASDLDRPAPVEGHKRRPPSKVGGHAMSLGSIWYPIITHIILQSVRGTRRTVRIAWDYLGFVSSTHYSTAPRALASTNGAPSRELAEPSMQGF